MARELQQMTTGEYACYVGGKFHPPDSAYCSVVTSPADSCAGSWYHPPRYHSERTHHTHG